ncbi:hypothetical protein TIFTF001_026421 [Ficus carica]|uniref:Uncharacterized protein n=1 Tax=Ficus carica TaxID=3494 RepID=A0AA88IYP9_FICCA|nr:hypothetical protein TIFTF001_026421 [Ficus carica]
MPPPCRAAVRSLSRGWECRWTEIVDLATSGYATEIVDSDGQEGRRERG